MLRLLRRNKHAQVKYEPIPQEESYPPQETCNKLRKLGIKDIYIRFLCDNYDNGFIKPKFFDEINVYWAVSPDNPRKAHLALIMMMRLIHSAINATRDDVVKYEHDMWEVFLQNMKKFLKLK